MWEGIGWNRLGVHRDAAAPAGAAAVSADVVSLEALRDARVHRRSVEAARARLAVPPAEHGYDLDDGEGPLDDERWEHRPPSLSVVRADDWW